MDAGKHLNRVMIGFAFVMLIYLVVIMSASSVGGKTITVAQDGNGDYETIMAAVENATEGDTIRVWEGTYATNNWVNKSVNLIGNESMQTIIANDEHNPGIWLIQLTGIRVSNFFISNCTQGIVLSRLDNCIVSNNNIQHTGIGIFDTGEIQNCTLINNTCKFNENGIFMSKSNNNSILNNTLIQNEDRGILLWQSSNNSLMYNTISENRRGILLEDHSIGNTAHFNNIAMNSMWGIVAYENNPYTINATNNWWGNESGPYHDTINSNGSANNISNFVELGTWLLESINEPPTAHIESILPNPSGEGTMIMFIGSGTDEGTITDYSWRTDGKELYHGPNESFSYSDLQVGNHTIFLKVRDGSGLWSEEVNDTITIFAPNKRPTVTITSPENGTKIKSVITISGTATDEDGDIQNVEILLPNGTWIEVNGTEAWSYELNTEDLDNGEFTIKVRSYDGSQYSEAASIVVTSDNADSENGDESSNPRILYIMLLIIIAVIMIFVTQRMKYSKD